MKKKTLSEIPSSVYRLQLNSEFPLKKVIKILPYLSQLGIEGLYLSPIFECISPHGYDITNPNRLNPALGTIDEFEELISLLQKQKMMLVLDIVPNHMGIKTHKNEWWQDVLQYGPDSAFQEFFDIDWNSDKKELKNKVLLPILEGSYGAVLENGLLKLVWKDAFWISYHDNLLPIRPETYSFILEHAHTSLPPLTETEEKEWTVCFNLCEEMKRIEPQEEDKTAQKESLKRKLVAILENSGFIRKRFDEIVRLFNGDVKDLSSFDHLHALLEQQFYKLAHWVVACQEINYRRFFNVNELVAIHTEKEKVLNMHHNWIFKLIEQKKVQGLRIDHPDGLYNPREYFERLKAKNPAFVVVEKILNFKEPLPENWAVDGSVGYEYLALLNGLFIQKQNEERFSRIYEKFIGTDIDFKTLLYERKKAFILFQMGGEINLLGSKLNQLSEKSRYYRDFTRPDLTRAIQEIMACFPVYRTYISKDEEITRNDKGYVFQAIEMAKTKAPEIDDSVFNYLKSILLMEFEHMSQEDVAEANDFLLRFEQLTAPVMAKGLEDSLYYIYNRLISLNEVGGNPKYFGYSKPEFHQFNKEKLEKWPFGFLPSSTHDTKFSQDVRMRINVLSEMPVRWQELVNKWKKQNEKYKKGHKGELFPDSNTEYYIYQMLIGMWPHSLEQTSSQEFTSRLWESLLKAIREAGLHTSWRHPNDEYEKAVKDFFFAITTPASDNFFYPSFLEFQKEIALSGRFNSLSQRILKIGSPGIVDVYQANEAWNFCLMDPDNRREVNFEKLAQTINSISFDLEASKKSEYVANLFKDSADDKLKMYITACGLNFRKKYKELLLNGSYEPLPIRDKVQDHIVAFMRKIDKQYALFISSRFFSKLVTNEHPLPLGEEIFNECSILLPKDLEVREFEDIFTGKVFKVQMKNKIPYLSLSDVFQTLPFSILFCEEKK